MIRKLLTLVVAVVVIASLVVGGCVKPVTPPEGPEEPAPAPSEKVYQWKLGTIFPAQSMPMGERLYTFADLVKERSND